MAESYNFPDDLVQAQRDFLAAEAQVKEIVDDDLMPSSIDIAKQEAVVPEDLEQALADARAAQMDMTLRLNRHDWSTFDNASNLQRWAPSRRGCALVLDRNGSRLDQTRRGPSSNRAHRSPSGFGVEQIGAEGMVEAEDRQHTIDLWCQIHQGYRAAVLFQPLLGVQQRPEA
ncbi:hypothetical protein Pmi06nite_63440 [Planotetraspora mira]|uniref:Uncharacterized protein n=1 Tax=Planotetraspora mira TaxID=58121 RepID=A0A8J3X968_9ACTN|nr:hypothetical protein Pmi06nite_63440 [Planotetraspora mira]